MGDYSSPDGRKVGVVSNMGALFSDGFGGSALDTTGRWDVWNGGLPANPSSPEGLGTLTQGAIGTGVAGITYSVANSILSVVMGTTPSAELWIISQGCFAGTEDLTILINRPAVITQNSVWIGLVEVDAHTELPLLNPNLANDFTNRGGVDFMKQSTSQADVILECVEDSSNVVATTGAVNVGAPASGTSFETLIEFESEDVIASTSTVDSALGRSSTVARLSSQVPNDGRKYKLLMRFRNIGTPGVSNTIQLLRVILVDRNEMRVEIASGRGDMVVQKGVAVNPTSAAIGAGNINTNQATVATTATLIAAARTGAPGAGRQSITIVNNGTATIYIGGSSVTTANGLGVPAGGQVTLLTTAAIYGIVATSTQPASYSELF